MGSWGEGFLPRLLQPRRSWQRVRPLLLLLPALEVDVGSEAPGCHMLQALLQLPVFLLSLLAQLRRRLLLRTILQLDVVGAGGAAGGAMGVLQVGLHRALEILIQDDELLFFLCFLLIRIHQEDLPLGLPHGRPGGGGVCL